MDMNKKLNIRYLSPSELVPNPWNSNVMSKENERKLEESLKRNELFEPILARTLEDGTVQILGGEHRSKVAAKLGYKKVPVNDLGSISDNRAKEISLAHNARYGSDDSLKLSELINSLDDTSILSEMLPYSDIEIDTLMSATKIDFDTLEPLDDDDIDEEEVEIKPVAKTHTIMRFKVSLEDADKIQDRIKEVMKRNGFNESDALTNAGDALSHLLLNEES